VYYSFHSFRTALFSDNALFWNVRKRLRIESVVGNTLTTYALRNTDGCLKTIQNVLMLIRESFRLVLFLYARARGCEIPDEDNPLPHSGGPTPHRYTTEATNDVLATESDSAPSESLQLRASQLLNCFGSCSRGSILPSATILTVLTSDYAYKGILSTHLCLTFYSTSHTLDRYNG
jgi:hypothetical protein